MIYLNECNLVIEAEIAQLNITSLLTDLQRTLILKPNLHLSFVILHRARLLRLFNLGIEDSSIYFADT